MLTASAERLKDFLTDVFIAAGTPADIAPIPAEHLVQANLSGYDSHGIVHIDHYLSEIDRGILVPSGRPEAIMRRTSALTLDAHHGWGHLAGLAAIDAGMEIAATTGVAAVSLVNCTHIGRLGHYVERAAAEGFVSMVTWGAGEPPTWGPPDPSLHLAAPYGGSVPALSTNPIAFGVPTGDDRPFVVDFASTVIANAKAWIYRDRGEQMPPGCALDKDGNPTTDPATYMDGGTLLLFGGHKGYGISLLTCLLGGLTGSFIAQPPSMDGPFMLVIDPTAFQPRETYEAAVRSFLDGMKSATPAPGFDAVLVPGDYEADSRRTRAGEIEVTERLRSALEAAAARFGVPLQLGSEASLS